MTRWTEVDSGGDGFHEGAAVKTVSSAGEDKADTTGARAFSDFFFFPPLFSLDRSFVTARRAKSDFITSLSRELENPQRKLTSKAALMTRTGIYEINCAP